jgi:hypothetical protein
MAVAKESESGVLMKWRAAVLGASVIALTASTRASDRLVVKVSPAVAFAPANLIVRATVESNQENRSIEIVAESDDFYRSSEMPLDGEHAPRTSLFEFRSLPTGSYQVRAILKGASGRELASTKAQVNIVGPGSGY